jgi:Predicted permease
MVAIGIMTSAGLWFLGVPLFATLGLIAALCNFVPYIGAIGGSIPAIIVALSQSPQTALWVALLFIAVQTLEGNLISPLISRRTVDLPPVLTLFSQTVLGTLFGPLGLVLATPITAATLLLVRMVYVEAILDDTD